MTITTSISSLGRVVRFSSYKWAFEFSGIPGKLQSLNAANCSIRTTLYHCHGECSILKRGNVLWEVKDSEI